MMGLCTTAYEVAARFIGEKEIAGDEDNPLIEYMVEMDSPWFDGDEVPWCSGFVNFVARVLGLQRSRSLRARSWLRVGREVPLSAARRGFDVVVLKRGSDPQPGPEVIDAPGHVGFFNGYTPEGSGLVSILGGNQKDAISIMAFDASDVLSVRRLGQEL